MGADGEQDCLQQVRDPAQHEKAGLLIQKAGKVPLQVPKYLQLQGAPLPTRPLGVLQHCQPGVGWPCPLPARGHSWPHPSLFLSGPCQGSSSRDPWTGRGRQGSAARGLGSS